MTKFRFRKSTFLKIPRFGGYGRLFLLPSKFMQSLKDLGFERFTMRSDFKKNLIKKY